MAFTATTVGRYAAEGAAVMVLTNLAMRRSAFAGGVMQFVVTSGAIGVAEHGVKMIPQLQES